MFIVSVGEHLVIIMTFCSTGDRAEQLSMDYGLAMNHCIASIKEKSINTLVMQDCKVNLAACS